MVISPDPPIVTEATPDEEIAVPTVIPTCVFEPGSVEVLEKYSETAYFTTVDKFIPSATLVRIV